MAPRGSDRCYWKPSIGVGDCQVVGTPAWTNPPTQSTSTTYDARNSRVQQVDGLTNGITTYDPDHNYQPRAVYLPTGSGRELQSLFTYDTRHRLDLVTHQLCVLSGAGHACSSTSPAGSDDYAYDDNDNRTAVLESNGSASSDHRYCYDALDHLRARNTAVACTTTSGDETYTYDDAGNRLTAPGDTFTYSPDGQLCQVDLAGPCPADPTTWQIRYDTAGRTSSYSGWTFAYDSAGRMTSACQSPTCAAGFDRVEFAYDGEGHRTRITETSAAGAVTTTDFRYQGDAVVQEVSGSITRDFVLDDQGTARKLTITGGTDAGTYVVVWNGHGDATGLWRVNADGTLTLANSFTYDTWGRPTLGTHNGIGDLGFRYRYVGASDVQWDDAFGLGLAYMHARHYSPALGRFLQPDPEAAEAEGNLYGYTESSPVTRADPDGRFWCLAGALAGGVGVIVACGAQVVAVVVAGVGLVYYSARTGAMLGELIRDNWRTDRAGSRPASRPTPTTRPCVGRAALGCQWYLARQDKKLSDSDIAGLKRRGIDPEELKDYDGSKDLFRKPNGDVVIKPKNGSGPGEPTGINLRDVFKRRR